MQFTTIQGSLSVFCKEGLYCAVLRIHGCAVLVATSVYRKALIERLVAMGIDEGLLTGQLPIEAEVSLPSSVVIPSAEALEKPFNKPAANALLKAVFQPPSE